MSSTTARRRRAARACRFCRSRKIKCNTEEPICSNCKVYGKDCVYEPTEDASPGAARVRSARSSPLTRATTRSATGDRPSPVTLSVENEDAAGAVNGAVNGGTVPRASLTPGEGPADADTAVASSGQRSDRPSASSHGLPSSHSTRVSRMVLSANGVSSYHGRTSALFEEPSHDRSGTEAPRPRLPGEWIEKGLVADAARQRQLEDVNFRAGRLDFDGVDPDLGFHLLSLHWNRQHHSFLITYRPAFMRDMACNGPYFSKLLLNAIYFGASKFSPRTEVRRDPNDVRTAGWRFRQRVRELLGESLDRSDITTIQALLVMTNSLFALGDERSAAWLYSGIAFRMTVDLGMHVDHPDLPGNRRFTDEDLEIRRRVFWGAFVVDKIQSLYQGRPVTIKESDTLVPIKFLDTYEELEPWEPFAYSTQSDLYSGSPAYSVSAFTALCRLSIVMSDILSSIYTERSFDQPSEDLLKVQDQLHTKLITWRNSLPAHLVFDPTKRDSSIPPPQVLSLLAMYHVFLILLHRPFVADGHLFSVSRSTSVNALMTCTAAATEIVHLIRAYHRTFSVRRAPYLISYATYVAATIHVRIASRRTPQSDAYSSLETCLAVFHENQETNWAARRATAIVQNLMHRFGVVLPEGRQPVIDPVGSSSRNADCGGQNVASNGADTGALTLQNRLREGRTPSETEGFDVDGIIQSFLRAQDGTGPDEGLPVGSNSLDPQHASGPHSALMGAATPGGHHGSDGVQGHHNHQSQQHAQSDLASRTLLPHGVSAGPFLPGADGGWQQGGMADGALSVGLVDDLLFGFHGSALDGYTTWQWDGS
ncbi:hypothetical protein RB597_006419 [Gaeumannomyces tritici]